MWLLGAWGSATLLHGTYNTLVFINHPVSIILALLMVIVGVVLSIRLMKSLTPKNKTTPITAKPRLKDIAKQGNPHAIARLINRSLKPKGISAQVALEKGCLQVMLTSNQVPSLDLVKVIHQGLIRLEVKSIERVKVYGKQVNDDIPDWHQEFELVIPISPKKTPSGKLSCLIRKLYTPFTPVKLSALITLTAISLVSLSYVTPKIIDKVATIQSPEIIQSQSIPTSEVSLQDEPEIAAAKQAVQANPQNYQSWYNFGQILSELEYYNEALAAYEQALKLNPNDVKSWSGLSLTLRRSERFEEALVAAKKALKINRNFAEGWKDKCGALLTLNRNHEALVACQKAVQLNPDFPQAWSNRGNALVELKRYHAALESYDRAIKLKPNYSNAWFNRALVLEEMQQLEEAKASYDKAIQYEPTSGLAWYGRGVLLGKLQQYEEALESYNQALKIDPYDSRAWNNRGLVLESLQRHDEAFKSYQKAIQIANIPAAWYNRGRLLERKGQYQEALAAYNTAIQLYPNYKAAITNRDNLLRRLER